MMNRNELKFGKIILMLAACLVFHGTGFAAQDIHQTDGAGTGKSLTGLFAVQPKTQFEDYARVGLDPDDLRDYTERGLQRVGLSVLSDAEAEAVTQAQGLHPASLLAEIDISDTEGGMVLVWIEVSLFQEVRLIRDTNQTAYAPTWSTRKSYVADSIDVKKIKDWYQSHLESFLNAYLSANPEKK